tara:strand:- start:402 stop:638 length:237 start_codon:yes stop_codon:yes gene_type:complete
MTTNSEIIIRSIEHQLNLDPGTIKPGMDLVEDCGADSLDLVEIVMQIEEQLDIEVPDDAVTELKLHDVDNLIKYIDTL